MWPPVPLGGCLATGLPDLEGDARRRTISSLVFDPASLGPRPNCVSELPCKKYRNQRETLPNLLPPQAGRICGVGRRLPKARRFADPLGASTGRRSDDDPSRAGEAVTRGRVFLWPSWRTSPSSAPGWSVSGWRGARARCRRLRHGRAARRARWREGAVGGRHRATATVTADGVRARARHHIYALITAGSGWWSSDWWSMPGSNRRPPQCHPVSVPRSTLGRDCSRGLKGVQNRPKVTDSLRTRAPRAICSAAADQLRTRDRCRAREPLRKAPSEARAGFAAPERPREGSTRASRKRVRASTLVCCRWRVDRLMLSAPRIPRGPRSREVGLFQHHRELMGFQVHARRPGARLR